MFIGEYQTQLGDKNRLALPKKLRSSDAVLIATRGYENCVLIVDSSRWNTLISEINKKPLLNLTLRDTKRFLIGGAHELELDAQGRFVLPESLKQYAHIDKEVVFLGVGEWIEIWDLDAWKSKLDYLSKNSADIADRL